MLDPTLATEAHALVGGDRQDAYGSPEANHRRIAALWSAYLGTEVSPGDVAVLFVLAKLSRSRNAYRRDNYVDAIAYLEIAESLSRR